MPITGVADLDSIIQTVVTDTILTARQMPVCRRMFRNYMVPEHRGSPFDLPKLGKLTAYPVAEGADYVAPQSLTDTDVSVNPTETIVQTMVTKRMLGRAPSDLKSMINEEHARAWSERMDLDGLALFSGFATGLSATNTTLFVGNFGAGRARVKGNAEPAPDPIVAILHPYHFWDLLAGSIPLSQGTTAVYSGQGNMMGGNAPNYANAAAGYNMRELFGVPIVEDGLITVDASDDAYSFIGSRQALYLCITDEGHMDPQWDASARAWELNFVGEYAWVERVDLWGYFLLADATAPTA